MSRLDQHFLDEFAQPTWKATCDWAGARLGVKPSSLKNLRDEFDPIHENARRGWLNRPMRNDRAEVVASFSTRSDEELLEVVRGILSRDSIVENEVIRPLAGTQQRIMNVAQRLRTGRLAEVFFVRNSAEICEITSSDLLDERELARGYDFAVRSRRSLRIEVKGLATSRGEIVFTDLEWRVAREYRGDYWLVVVGRVPDNPTAKLFRNPRASLLVSQVVEQIERLSWRSRVSVV